MAGVRLRQCLAGDWLIGKGGGPFYSFKQAGTKEEGKGGRPKEVVTKGI